MNLSKPPALATWMLEHLALGIDTDALAGDLLEEFRRRCSVAWCWRQVLMAIFLGFLKRTRSPMESSVFRTRVDCPLSHRIACVVSKQSFSGLAGWAIGHDWPESIVPQFLVWWFGLAFYLVMMRSFSARRFGRGVLINLFFGLLAFGFDLSSWGIVLLRELPVRALPFAYWTPYFLALMLSNSVTLPSAAITRGNRIPVSE